MADSSDSKLPQDSTTNPALLALRQRIDALDRELLAVLDGEERVWLERILDKLIDEGHDALVRAAAANAGR